MGEMSMRQWALLFIPTKRCIEAWDDRCTAAQGAPARCMGVNDCQFGSCCRSGKRKSVRARLEGSGAGCSDPLNSGGGAIHCGPPARRSLSCRGGYYAVS